VPNYDFHCARHGIFEAMSSADDNGVASVVCPRCGELAPVIWRRSPAMRKQGYEAIRFGGHDIPCESIEKQLAEPDQDDELPMFSESGFDDGLMATLDKNTQKWFGGTLPPVVEQMSGAELDTLRAGLATSGIGAKG
jgi:putative FmdB family regulatory protein